MQEVISHGRGSGGAQEVGWSSTRVRERGCARGGMRCDTQQGWTVTVKREVLIALRNG